MIDELIKKFKEAGIRKEESNQFIIWFKDVSMDYEQIIGSKAYFLSKTYQKGFLVPNGFVILPQAFSFFIQKSQNNSKIKSYLNEIKNCTNEDRIENLANEIQKKIFYSEISPLLKEVIIDSFKSVRLNEKTSAAELLHSEQQETNVSLRQSQDLKLEFPFHTSFLNIGKGELLEAVKTIWASNFTKSNVLKYKENPEILFNTSIVVQEMIQCTKAGTILIDYDEKGVFSQVKACIGYGTAITNNLIAPDVYNVNLLNFFIKEIILNEQDFYFSIDKLTNKITKRTNQKKGSQIFSDVDVRDICYMGKKLCLELKETGFIEFGVKDDKIYIFEFKPGDKEFNLEILEEFKNQEKENLKKEESQLSQKEENFVEEEKQSMSFENITKEKEDMDNFEDLVLFEDMNSVHMNNTVNKKKEEFELKSEVNINNNYSDNSYVPDSNSSNKDISNNTLNSSEIESLEKEYHNNTKINNLDLVNEEKKSIANNDEVNVHSIQNKQNDFVIEEIEEKEDILKLYDELYHDNDSKKDENTSNFEKNNNFENGKTNTFVEKSENLSNPNQNNSFITNSKVETISQSNSIFSNLNQGNNAINEDNDYLNNNFSEKSTEMNNEEDVPSLLYRFKNDDDINNDDEKQETYTTDNNFLNSNSTPNYDNGVSEQLNSDNQHTRNYQDEKYNNTPYQDKFSVDNVNSYETINSNTNKDNTTFQKEPNTNNVFSSETDQTTQLKEILQNYYVNINKKILLNQINDQEILEKKEEIEETIKTLEYSDTKEIINKIYIAQEILEYLKRIKK